MLPPLLPRTLRQLQLVLVSCKMLATYTSMYMPSTLFVLLAGLLGRGREPFLRHLQALHTGPHHGRGV